MSEEVKCGSHALKDLKDISYVHFHPHRASHSQARQTGVLLQSLDSPTSKVFNLKPADSLLTPDPSILKSDEGNSLDGGEHRRQVTSDFLF